MTALVLQGDPDYAFPVKASESISSLSLSLSYPPIDEVSKENGTELSPS